MYVCLLSGKLTDLQFGLVTLACQGSHRFSSPLSLSLSLPSKQGQRKSRAALVAIFLHRSKTHYLVRSKAEGISRHTLPRITIDMPYILVRTYIRLREVPQLRCFICGSPARCLAATRTTTTTGRATPAWPGGGGRGRRRWRRTCSGPRASSRPGEPPSGIRRALG